MGVKLKLLVNKDKKKVVYSETGQEFVDFFLMGLMEIPLGSILQLIKHDLKDEATTATLSFSKLYESIHLLEDSYLKKSHLRNSVLNPKFAFDSRVKQAPILKEMIHGGSSSSTFAKDEIDGYVKGATIYMVMDDLTISPSSTISSVSNLNNKHDITADNLEEMTVEVDGKKALELVRTAFQSSTVLSDVFLRKDLQQNIDAAQHH